MKLLLPFALLFVLFPRADVRGDCDLAKVERAKYCESCSEVKLADQLVSKKVYFECSDCGAKQDKAGKCSDCDVVLAKITSDVDVCDTCYQKPVACEVCVKMHFECPDCGASADKAGKCVDCEVVLQKNVSRALIKYECGECATESFTPGKCSDEDCASHGKALRKTCTESGHPPHVSAG